MRNFAPAATYEGNCILLGVRWWVPRVPLISSCGSSSSLSTRPSLSCHPREVQAQGMFSWSGVERDRFAGEEGTNLAGAWRQIQGSMGVLDFLTIFRSKLSLSISPQVHFGSQGRTLGLVLGGPVPHWRGSQKEGTIFDLRRKIGRLISSPAFLGYMPPRCPLIAVCCCCVHKWSDE